MNCKPEVLKSVPLFSLLDEEETEVLARQVKVKTFAAWERIYKAGDPGVQAYVIVSGRVRISAVDEDQQEVVADEAVQGEFFGLASMLERTRHQATAIAVENSVCLEVSRGAMETLLERKPQAGMDLLTVLGRQFETAQRRMRTGALHSPKEILEKETTFGERIADAVAGFGGSWTFLVGLIVSLTVYTVADVTRGSKGWNPYSFLLLNLFVSLVAAIGAPVILMSQNRQNKRDRLRSELDFDASRRTESEIKKLSQKLNLLDEKLGSVQCLLREKERFEASLH